MSPEEFLAIKNGSWKKTFGKDKIFIYTDDDDEQLRTLVNHFVERQKLVGDKIIQESPYHLLKENKLDETFERCMKDYRLVVDCETDGLYGHFLSVAFLVVDAKNEIEKVIYIYDSSAVQSELPFVSEQVLPRLKATEKDLTAVFGSTVAYGIFPVASEASLFEKAVEVTKEYTSANLYAEHLFPVEWRFFKDERFSELKFNLVEVAQEVTSYFDEDNLIDQANQHKAWYDAYKTYEQLRNLRPYSSHTFVLPFTIIGREQSHNEWSSPSKDMWVKIDSFKDMPYFHQKYYPLTSKQADDYLFYTFERFFNDEFLEVVKGSKSINYKLKKGDFDYYQIIIHEKNNKKSSYFLQLDSVFLRFLDEAQNLGFLVISCHNLDYPLTDDINRINQYGRRVYEPFLSEDPVYQESPYDLRLVSQAQKEEWSEDSTPSKDVDFVQKPKSAIKDLLTWFFGDRVDLFYKQTDNRPLLTSIIDDRMFVHSNFVLKPNEFELLADSIRGKEYSEFFQAIASHDLKAIYEQEQQLYKYIYIDNGYPTYQSPVSIRDVLEQSVYDRWLDYGTFYGVTQHSMQMFLKQPTPPGFLFTYFYSEYLELSLFVLAQRMKILDFSFRAGAVAESIKDGDRAAVQKSLDLQKDYVVFKNQYLLAEISPQEQAVDLYRRLQKNLYVAEQKELLDDQIQSLYEIGITQDNIRQNEQNNLLNRIAIGLAVLTIFTALSDFSGSLDIAFGENNKLIAGLAHYKVYLILVFVIIVIVMDVYRRLSKRIKG